MEKPDLLERLTNRHGLNSAELDELQMEAWAEIRRLREEIKRLAKPGLVTDVLRYRSTAERIENMPPIGS